MNDRIGQQLGNYRLLRLLGRGGQASVYPGEHLYLGSQAAVKVRHTVLTDEEQTVFLQEAQTLVRLTHPHIVRVLDYALQDGMPFLVMEYAPHGTLRQRHPRGTRLPLDVILPYVQQIASALQYTHDQGLIHRDVKPENMLLSSRDEVLLSDFGLVMLAPQPLSSGGTELMEPSLAGTTSYLAPEQLRGKARSASDQYALALSLTHFRNAKRSAIQPATSGTVNNGRGRQRCEPDAEYPRATSVRAERCLCRVGHADRSDRGAHDGYRLPPSA